MLEVFVNFICAFMLAVLGFYIIKEIISSKEKLTISKIFYLIISSALVDFIHFMNYPVSALLNFIINTLIYKKIFKINIEQSMLLSAILFLFILFADIINIIIQMMFLKSISIKEDILIYLISNINVIIIAIILIKIINIKSIITKFYKTLILKDLKLNTIFLILIIMAASAIAYYAFNNYKFNASFISDIILIFSLLLICIIFINNRKSYNKLSNEYDILLSNVQTFEDWIEKEQFTRHEYKNQLAILYALSSENNIKNKIEEIINQNLNIKDEVVNNLKDLPKGGLKGLLYYKTIVAENNKLKITVNVSIKEKGILKKLSKKNNNTIAKIVGIIYDNAIDAAKESRKKIILLEIYELKDKVNIVISNTFKKNSIIEKRFEKGATSKGSGHGNGLYYMHKILKTNSWIEEKQEIIDNYYIETITIKKNTSKK